MIRDISYDIHMRYEQRTEKKIFFSSKKYGNGNVAGSFLFPEVSYIYLVHKQRYSTALDILALPSSSVVLPSLSP